MNTVKLHKYSNGGRKCAEFSIIHCIAQHNGQCATNPGIVYAHAEVADRSLEEVVLC